MSKTWIAGGVLAVAMATPGVVHAADPELTRLQRQIDQLQRDVDAERQQYEAEQTRQKAWDASAKSQLSDTRAQGRRARAEADSLSRALAALGSPAQNRAEEMKVAKKEADAFAAALATQTEAVLEKLLREELPGFAEAHERPLRDLARGLRTGVTPPDEGLGRLLDELSAIIDYGRKVEARPGSYTTLAGRPVDGHFVSAGGVFEAFVSTDGAVAAYRQKTGRGNNGGWEWKESLPVERRQNLLKVARMLQGSENPGFVAIPFGLVSGGEP
jgi:hypothetical protein